MRPCPQGLSESLGERESQLEGLRAAAEPLQASCSAEVAAEIEAAVSEAVSAWEDTVASLQGLCDRYQNAVQLWQQYREASEALSTWADGAADTADSLAPQQALAQVKVGVTCYTYTRYYSETTSTSNGLRPLRRGGSVK